VPRASGSRSRESTSSMIGSSRKASRAFAEAPAWIGVTRPISRGSLSHADPASELGAVALTYGGRVAIAGADGERSVAIDDFFEGFFATVGSGDGCQADLSRDARSPRCAHRKPRTETRSPRSLRQGRKRPLRFKRRSPT
jgi:hypothetical protein